jgi:hypothetical protein
MSELQTRKGVYDYSIDFNDTTVGPAQSLKVLVYIPGYRMVAAEFKEAEIRSGKIFIPPLVPLATTALTGRLVDPKQKPLSDQTLRLEYFLLEVMTYFGYGDGSVPSLSIGDIKTDARGEFTVNIPAFGDDAFFNSGWFQLNSSEGLSFLGSHQLKPNSFPARKVYEPLVITDVGRGTLSGTLGKETLKQNNLSEDLRAYVRPQDTIVTGITLHAKGESVTYNADLQVDGSFEVQLPPGEYELELWAPQLRVPIPIQHNLIIEPEKRRVLSIP